jgi:regulator of RNase E activity RraA
MGFATYARAVVPYRMGDRVRFAGAGADVDIEGVAVSPGWLAVADLNGAVFVPPAAIGAVARRARQAAEEESANLEAIRAGSDPAAVLVGRGGQRPA